MAKNTYRGYNYIKSSGGIDEYQLISNELTVLLMEDHSAPVATFMVTYHVGSRNEAVGHTGATHLLEHLMFKGSKQYNKERGRSLWTVLQNVGAQINATTGTDRTNYFELLPKEHLEEAIKIEADRMRYAFIREADRESEMTVVRNEFERGENSPYQALDKLIWSTAYQAHPYHHSTIGWRSDIENVPIERLKEFYDTFYWPNNATVTIIGDFETEAALALVKRHFGRLKKSPHKIPEVYTKEPEQEGPRRVEVRRTGQTGIVGIAHKTLPGTHADMYAFQVLSKVLYGGKTGSFYKKIVDKGLATNMIVDDHPWRDNGLFVVFAFLTPGTDHEEVEKIILGEYEAIMKNGVPEQAVKRAKAQIRSEAAFSRDGSYSIAANLNEAIAVGDWTYYTTFMERINEVSAADIQRIVETYLIEDKSTTGYFIPKNNDGELGGLDESLGNAHHPYNWRSEEEPLGSSGVFKEQSGAASAGSSIADQIEDLTPIKGLRLLALKTGVKNVVTINGSFPGGDEFSPKENFMLADITAAMLDQGTKRKTKFEISEELESVGAELSFSSDTYRVRFNIHCLKEDVSLVLSLLAEQLKEPAFNEEDLESVKRQYIGRLERAKESTRYQANTSFSQILYPQNHPSYRMGADAAIEAVNRINVDDLRTFHDEKYGLGSMLVVAVGDVDSGHLTKELKKHFSGWKTSSLTIKGGTITANKRSARIKYVTVKDKTSVDAYLGLAIGIDRDHPDYYPLMLGNFVLGGNFSARLMSTVRDQQGLTYGVYSDIRGIDNNNDGYWYVWGTFGPELLQKGKAAELEQVTKWVQEGITAEELAAKKTTITGSFKVGLATTGGMAGQILTNAERGRPNEHLDKFPQIVENLTLNQVNEAIKKYIDLNELVFVAAGSVDENGKPLED